MKLKTTTRTFIEERDWNEFVSNTYGRPYNFQQQDGCQDRGIFSITVPNNYDPEPYMNDEVPEEVNHEIMGVKFEKWLERDPQQPIKDQKYDYQLGLWWERNFYPDIHSVVNDLHKKGLLDAGEYVINIDW